MVDLNEAIGTVVPNFSGVSAGSIFGVFAYLIFIVLMIIVGGVITWFILKRRRYKNKIIVFEKINDKWQVTKKERAIEMKYGPGGDTIFQTDKTKKLLPRPTIQSGPREYWYFIRKDGEWINFSMTDIDEVSKRAGVQFLDKEVRYARTQIQRGLKERYDKKSWLAENWTVVAGIGFVAMIGIMTFLLFDKWIELASTTNAGMETANKVLEKAGQILGAIDNIGSGGSGIVPAG